MLTLASSTACGIVTLAMLPHPMNAFCPMLVKPEPNVTFVSPEHPLNA